MIRANLYPSLADHESQEFASTYAKDAFRRIQLHVILPQEVKNFLRVEDMLLSGFALNHDIINTYFYRVAYQRFEDLRHQSLISGAGVFESERHDSVAIEVVWRYECCFFLVSRGHGDLVISGEGIQESIPCPAVESTI